MATILIGADICPIGVNQPLFRRGDASSLFHDLLPELEAADLVIANLECPLIERPSPIAKTGPNFGEPGDCINGIKAAGVDVLCLANNHILDHGAAGLANTMQVCAQAGIATVGAGPTLADARRMLIRRIGPIRLAILALAENEFSVARNGLPGANPLNLISFVREVQRERQNFDYLIVLFHGGDEFCVPSPRLKDTCQFMIEQGANAVIVQHPHVLGGYEEYRGGHIVYGQGALVMDEAIYRDRKSFHEGFLVKLTVTSDNRASVGRVTPCAPGLAPASRGPASTPSLPPWEERAGERRFTASMEIIPFVQSDPAPGARKLTGETERKFRETLAQRSAAILDDTFVAREWEKFCTEHQRGYLNGVLGHNRVVRKLDVGGWLSRLVHSPRALLGTRNCVLCETHREALETIFTRLLK